MIYAMSDIHGCYDKYIEMLKKIGFSAEDTLYIIGDVIDRGENGIKILQDMRYRENVVPILGNHEYMAYAVLKRLNVEITEESVEDIDKDLMKALLYWQENGGVRTMKEFKTLSRDDREGILDYLTEFSLYERVIMNGKEYILLHSGPMNFSEERDMDEYSPYELIFERSDYSKKYFNEKILITGHTPTFIIGESHRGKIYMGNNHIAIDCGAVYGEKLACLRLDDMKEFYV